MKRSIFVLLSALAVAGCSTMIDHTFQVVSFDTPGIVDADCDIQTPNHHYRVVTPGKVQIDRSPSTLDIVCKKSLYYPVTLHVKPKYELNHSLLNVFNGLVPGMAYDTASNANFEYPHVITIGMELDPAAVAASRGDLEETPEPPQKKAIEAPIVEEPVIDARPAEKTMSKSLRK